MRRSCLAFSLLLSLAVSSYGGVIGYLTPTAPPFSTPDSALTGHTGYMLTAVTDDGSLISAVDIRVTGKLHQRWVVNPDTGESIPTPNATVTSAGVFSNSDSKLILVPNALIAAAPVEDNNVSQSPLTDTATHDYGYSSFLRAAWGFTSVDRSTRITIGYLVIPDADFPNISITAQIGTFAGTFPLIIALPGFGPILTSTPIVGSGVECHTCIAGQRISAPISLQNTGGGTIKISSITLAGPNAANFILIGTLPTQLIGGEPRSTFNVAFASPGAPIGVYSAQVLVNTSAGNLVFDVSDFCPEPSALLIAGLAVVGFAIRARR